MDNNLTVIEEFSMPTDSSNDQETNVSLNATIDDVRIEEKNAPVTSPNKTRNIATNHTSASSGSKIDDSLQTSIHSTFRLRTSSNLQREIMKCTKKYRIKLPCGTEEDAKQAVGTLKRISWSRTGKYFLRTDKPKLLSFRNGGPNNNQIHHQNSGFDEDKTYMRLNFAPVQSFMRANILVFIHSGEPPECPDNISPDEFVPKYYPPVETLLFEVTYTFLEDVSATYINWRRLRNATKFTYVQLRQLHDQFMYDTRQNGHCGVLQRNDFGRILRNFSLVGINETELNKLWIWFNRGEQQSCIDFETFAEGLGKTWHDAHFFGLSSAAREAIKEEKKYEQMDEEDKKAREQAIYDVQLKDVEKAYSRLTGSPIPPSPSFMSSSQKNKNRRNSTLSHVTGDSSSESLLDKLIAVSENVKEQKVSDDDNNDMNVLLAALNSDGNTPRSNIQPKTPPRLGIPSSLTDIKSPRGIRAGNGINFTQDQVESRLQNAYDTVMKKKRTDDGDGGEDEEMPNNNNDVDNENSDSKIYGSPDRSLAKLYKDHPLARTFIRACSMSPMTPELMDSLANAFANELAESAMFKTDASPVVPLLDLSKIGDSGNDEDKIEEEKDVEKEALQMAKAIARERAKKAYKKYDKDGKSGIDQKEFKQICIDLGVAASKEERREAMEILDTDGSGNIGKEEFVAWYSEMTEKSVEKSDCVDSSDNTDSGDFIPSVLKDAEDGESMDISQVANLANTSAKGKFSSWVGNLIVIVHSANELIIPATAKPFVKVSFLDLAPDVDNGSVHPHEDTEYQTPSSDDAFDVKWNAKDATFKVENLLTIPDIDSKKTPNDIIDTLPLYGNGEIYFKVDCGLEVGVIGTASLSLADLHGKICNIIESDKDNTENHGFIHHSIDLKPPIHLRTSSLDGIGSLEVSATIEFKRKQNDEADYHSDTPKTSGRKGVREGFGEHEMALVVDKLRTARRSSGIKVTDLFKSMDDEKKGSISREAFSRAIISFGADVSKVEAGLVFDHFDVHGHGRMMYADYVKMMVSAPAGEVKTITQLRKEERLKEAKKEHEKEKLIEKVNLQAMVARIRTERRKREILPQALYDLFDKDNSGAISKDEMVDALERWNFSHTEDEINAIYAVYAGHDGLMDYSDFLTFVTGGTSKSGKRVKRAIHPNHRRAGDMQNDGAVTTDEEVIASESDSEIDETEREAAKQKREREKRQRRFIRQRSLGFAAPETSYVQMTIYGGENLALDKKGKEPKNPVVHIKAVGLRNKKISTKKGKTRSPTWNFTTEIGKNSKVGITKLRKFNIKVKDGTRTLGVVDVDFNIMQFSRSTEERMKHPLCKHDDQKMFEEDDDTLGFIDVGIRVISKVKGVNSNDDDSKKKKIGDHDEKKDGYKRKRPKKIVTTED